MNEKHKLSWVNHGTKLKLSTTIDQRNNNDRDQKAICILLYSRH